MLTTATKPIQRRLYKRYSWGGLFGRSSTEPDPFTVHIWSDPPKQPSDALPVKSQQAMRINMHSPDGISIEASPSSISPQSAQSAIEYDARKRRDIPSQFEMSDLAMRMTDLSWTCQRRARAGHESLRWGKEQGNRTGGCAGTGAA